MISVLEGKNIILRKATLEDAKTMYENYWSDHIVAQTMWWKIEESLESAIARVERTIDYQKDHDGFFVALKSNNEPIGMAGIFVKEEGVYEESGIGLARKHQGKGYGKEIMELLLQLAFKERNAKKFVYCAFDSNERSIALAKHFGFHYVGSHKETRYDNKEFIINEYELDREEYILQIGKQYD